MAQASPSRPTSPFLPLLLALLAITSGWRTAAAARPLLPPYSRMLVLVPSPATTLSYHGGPLLTSPKLRLHLLWYGAFPASQQAVITDFIASFQDNIKGASSVASWWKIARRYKDSSNAGVSAHIQLGLVSSDPSYRMGKNLTKSDIATLVEQSVASGALPKSKRSGDSVYVVFTADNVLVEDFCMNSCGFHSAASSASLPFIWVGNAATQCPGLCAWPYAVPEFGPPGPPLLPPNGEAATDGMVINLATLLAGTVTNPFDSGYYQGDATAPLEAASACEGEFGKGSYPGYPGKLLVDQVSGASYNALGVNGRKFLLPALWNPTTLACQPPV